MNTNTTPSATPRISPDVAQALHQAADRIEATGLHQGGFYPGWTDTLDALLGAEVGEYLRDHDTLPCCLEAAVWTTAPTAGTAQEALRRVREEIQSRCGLNISPADWNDASTRTADDVIRLLRATAGELVPA